LLMGADGNLYGVTRIGGTYHDGTVFELNTTTDVLATLYSFNGSDGANPIAGLYADASGNLFGTTYAGGANGQGTLFELSPVPEPSAFVLLAVGIIAILSYAGRR
jgi:uncharacterized repeat protein (TIGR03803 family)